jgi:hypothetical protein
MSNQEKDRFNSHEAFDDKNLEALNNEQGEKIKENLERNVENKSHEALEGARKEAFEQAASVEKKHDAKREQSPAERRGPLTKKERDRSFDNTMEEVRSQMSGPSRAFSKVIHNKTVEKVSDAVGSTIARPNAILSGSIFAFVFTLVVYLIARYNGYPLSGAETIASFALGWVLGLIFDYFRVLVSGKTQ